MLVGALRIYIRPIAHILAGFGRKDWGDLAHAVLAEAHIEVPFIHHLEGFHAVGDRVFGEGFEIRRPHRVHGKLVFIVATDPVLHRLARVARGHFHPVMRAPDSDALGNEVIDQFGARGLNGRMPTAAISIDQDGVHALEGVIALGPTHVVHFGGDAGQLIEAFLEQQTTGPEFVIARPVTGPAGDEQDFFIS